jgi:hypothetical protein
MKVVSKHYRDLGWTVDDVSDRSPYDLLCSKDGREVRRVEVKGTTGDAAAIILTRNEVVAAQSDPAATVLAVVHGITLSGQGTEASGGALKVISPWTVDERALTPIAYRYQVSIRHPSRASSAPTLTDEGD